MAFNTLTTISGKGDQVDKSKSGNRRQGGGSGGAVGIRGRRSAEDLSFRQQKNLPLIGIGGIATHLLLNRFTTTSAPQLPAVTTTTITTALDGDRKKRALPLAIAPLLLPGGIALGKESIRWLAPYLVKGTMYEVIGKSHSTNNCMTDTCTH